MKNNRFSLIIIIRVILITINCFILIWFYKQTGRPATTLFFLLLLVFQTYNLIYYLNQINRDLANFLVFLQENDTTLAFSKKRIEKNFKGLIHNLNKINQKIQEARIGKEQQHQYLQVLVEHVGVGLIAFTEEGRVEIVNNAARKLFGIHSLMDIGKLKNLYPELSGALTMEKKNQPSLMKLKKQNDELQLAVKSTVIKINESKIKLVSFQNIKNELEVQELESWRKLIRILRHEIMNSITPITTLTTAIKRSFRKGEKRKNLSEINDENIDDALTSAEVIEERSLGLIEFVEKFRSLTELPKPKFDIFPIKKITDRMQVLFSNELKSKKIKLSADIENENLELLADEKLIEQVIINLLKNAIEANLKPGGNINIKAFQKAEGDICIRITDNGIGIQEETLETVFIPSYSTKENGTGIGLSLSKQILQLHGATIHARSIPGKETVFEMTFPA